MGYACYTIAIMLKSLSCCNCFCVSIIDASVHKLCEHCTCSETSLSTTVFTQLTISTADCLRKPYTAQQMAVEHTHIWELHTLIVNELLAAPSSCS